MIVDVNGKTFVVGLEWRTQVTSDNIAKAIRKEKAKWYWHRDPSAAYGILSKEDHKDKKKAPVYSAMIALTLRQSDGNMLAIISIPDTEYYAVLGVVSGRPLSGFDYVIDSLESLSTIIEDFQKNCDGQPYSLIGDIGPELVQVTFFDLLNHATEFSQLRKVGSEIVNPATIVLAIGLIGLAANFGWKKYVEYKKVEAEKKIAANQKSAQQLYDEAIEVKKTESVFLARDAALLKSAIAQLPSTVSGWTLDLGKCSASQTKQFICKLKFVRSEVSGATNENFNLAAPKYKLNSIVYLADLKNIEATLLIDGLPFVPMSTVFESSVQQEQEWITFGTQLQRLLPFGSPSLQSYVPFGLPAGVDSSQLVNKPYHSAKWNPTGPIRMLDLFNTFPKYATIEQLDFVVGKAPQPTFNQSIVSVSVSGSAFSKEKN